MKKITSFLVALCVMATASQKMYAETVTVTSNSSSGIENANVTATLNDGTILGFYIYNSSYIYFCGAISQRTELSIPDKISYSGSTYDVNRIGYNRCDFDNAQSVTSLILPATISYINYLPQTVKVLHTNSYISDLRSGQLSNLTKVLVPEADLESYYGNTDWRNYVLINAEGTEPLKITVNMTKAGEFAQLLLQQIDNWYKVNELTVVGELNTDDLNVFKRMKQLTKLDLSRAVITDIPNQFDGASSYYDYRDGFNLLEDLILPEVNKIGEYAFAQCYRLKNVTMPKVNTIGYGAFARCAASQIILPNGITSIGNYAFYASSIENISVPSSITEISNYCFEYCSRLESINIPSSVTKIGNEAFCRSGLTSINLLNVETIGEYAFSNCAQLASANLTKVKTLGYESFYNCQKLAEVKFAEGLESLGSESFSGCTALTEIDLPSTLYNVNSQAFRNCTNIKKVTSRAVIPPTHNNSNFLLNGCDMTDVKLYVPAMSIDKYRKENGWKQFYTILPMEDKTSNVYIYDNITIDDASQFTTDCDMTIDWMYQNRTGSSQYYCGAVDYNGSTTFSVHDYKQYQYLGRSNSNNPYSYEAHFTSLIPNGTMRADNVQITLRTYSTSIWYFISLPYDVKVSDIIYTGGTQFAIRKYSGQNRASQSGSTWVNLTEDDTMNAYEGYILRCNKENANFTFPAINNANKNKVFEKESVVMPLGEYLSEFEHNRSWNLIGNPYPCYYDTRLMDFTAPITVWNRYNGRYDAYSPVDDSYILHPAQAFFVQRPVDQASITFDKAGRQKDATVRYLPSSARKRAAKNTNRKVYNIIMCNGMTEDHTRFVINEEAISGYELDKDASKFITDDNTSMLLYTIENGVKFAINERPMSDGIVNLGFFAPEEGEYTLSLSTTQSDNIILIDHEANTETSLTGEYHFNTSAGFNNTRFTLMFGEATGISTIQGKGTQINVENGVVSANTPYTVYTMDGRLVGDYAAGFTAVLSKGVYVIYSKDVKRKIVVK